MKILMHYRGYPVAMGRYFRMAFERLGHEVKLAGPIDPRGAEWIPWGDYRFPKYAQMPDVLLPAVNDFELDIVLAQLGDWKPDLIIQAADVSFLKGKAPCPNYLIMTDPHAIDYSGMLENIDHVFNMQKFYMELNPINKPTTYLPYAYDPTIHKIVPQDNNYDVVFIGLQYPQRMEVLNAIKDMGYRVFNQLGVIYEESNEVYNQGHIAFNWSSKLDVPARVFEGLACGRLLITNRLPDLPVLGLVEGRDYIGFSNTVEAIEKINHYLKNPEEARKIAEQGHKTIQGQTWDARCEKILEVFNG